MNYGIVVSNDFTSFSDDEKLNYSLKLALSRLQTELKRAWYQEPKDSAPKGPETIYKNKIPTYEEIKNYCENTKSIYVDYHTSMKDKRDGLKDEFTYWVEEVERYDGVHPNKEGYIHMEKIVSKKIKEVL